MDAGVKCNKEMVDLLMRIKKHLNTRHRIALNMSDPHLMTSLLELASIRDDVLQGMIQYLMAMAGGDWNRRYLAAAGKTVPSAPGKSFASRIRDIIPESTATHAAVDAPGPEKTPVRYYRGQPVYG